MNSSLAKQIDYLPISGLNLNLKPREIYSDDKTLNTKSFKDAVENARKAEEKPVEKESVSMKSSEENSLKSENKEIPAKVEQSEKYEKTDSSEKKTSEKKPEVKSAFLKESISEKNKIKAENVENKPLASVKVSANEKVSLHSEKKDEKKVSSDKKNSSKNSRNISEKKNSEENSVIEKIIIMKNPEAENKIDAKKDFHDEKNDFEIKSAAISEKSSIKESDDSMIQEFSSSENVKYLDKDKKIAVHDLRTETKVSDEEGKEVSPKEKSENLKVTSAKFEGNHAELTLDLNQNQNAQGIQDNILSSNDQAAGANGSSFQAMLTNELSENAGEIVKAGSIVLKNNDIGSIKLVLHPKALGDVKIDLELNDKVISGKIVVASEDAFNAFKDSADNLRQSFNESGYETNGFELSLENNGASSSGQESFQEQKKDFNHYDVAFSYGEGEVREDFESEFEKNFEYSLKNGVNIVA